jgi:hypothetical protein
VLIAGDFPGRIDCFALRAVDGGVAAVSLAPDTPPLVSSNNVLAFPHRLAPFGEVGRTLRTAVYTELKVRFTICGLILYK